ncbi:aconitase family protein [Daejeonella lutea]|uniref:3-isopropylmalate dehydratase n=1 Tax=Daejeonella lutea TaxID=572036 RepID=A0A1T5F1M4_9SPHI|nr:aconitase family protein [Daejeonella lutea]SKB90085.1 3-isopropylmalate/(R)-2-methylmalate dehydratase large subunit [Daejeonella lutea]
MALTLFDKIWNEHIVSRSSGFPDTLFIDTHFINKLTSPRAFDSLRKRNMPVFRPKQTVPISEPEYTAHIPLSDLERFHLDLLNRNCSDFGIEASGQQRNFDGSLIGFPGQTIVCDPDNTDNLGALGVIALGVHEGQVEQVLATQCLLKQKPKRMKIEVNGKLEKGLGSKDINHYLIAEISSDGASGYFIEFSGDTILNLDMDGRMAICNMSREIGAIGGIMAPDALTFDYLRDLGLISANVLEQYPEGWKYLFSDEASVFDEVLEFDAEDIRPGNYGIGLSKLMNNKAQESVSQSSFDDKGLIEGHNDTDYILSQQDMIEEFERVKTNKNLMV